jgi:hypothetical protein
MFPCGEQIFIFIYSSDEMLFFLRNLDSNYLCGLSEARSANKQALVG